MSRHKGKSATAFRTISEVSDELEVPQHVLRFWETKFSQVRPMKRGGGRRYYRPEDVDLLRRIRNLLYQDGYTIKGVQKLLREGGAKQAPSNQAPPTDVAQLEAAQAPLGSVPGAPKATSPDSDVPMAAPAAASVGTVEEPLSSSLSSANDLRGTSVPEGGWRGIDTSEDSVDTATHGLAQPTGGVAIAEKPLVSVEQESTPFQSCLNDQKRGEIQAIKKELEELSALLKG